MALMACGDPVPPGRPVKEWIPPVVIDSAGITWVVNTGPRRLVDPSRVDTATGGALHLLFVDGRATTALSDGGFGWADLAGARGIVFDETGSVRTVLQGAPEGGPPPGRPAFVVDRPGGWRMVESDGRVLAFEGSTPVSWLEPAGSGVLVSSLARRDIRARTVLEFEQRPVRPDEPLMWLDGAGLGTTEVPPEPLLGQLHNAGWVAATPGGTVAFAAATRPELQIFAPDGTLRRARFPVEEPAHELRFILMDGDLHPRFRAVTHGLAWGPKGRTLYALVDSDGAEGAERVLAFDRSGVLVAGARVTPNLAVAVTADGRLATLDVPSLLARTPEARDRPTFPEFAWPRLGASDTIESRSVDRPVVVLNMWASWCAPCRRELPLLAEFSRSPEARDVAVIGFNDDIRVSDALDFLDELGGLPFPSAYGGGGFRREYAYRGLPYTVVLDADRRIVGTVYGFGNSIDPIRTLVDRARGQVSSLRTDR